VVLKDTPLSHDIKTAFPNGEVEEGVLLYKRPGLGSQGKDELLGPKKAVHEREREREGGRE
jgi:hypothetical protein